MASSHCTPETASTFTVDRPEQDHGVNVAYCDDETVNESDKTFLCLRQKTCWIGAVVLFVLAGIVTIAVVALGATSGNTTGTSDGSESIAPRESEAFYQERYAALRPVIGQFSETSTLVQTGTPQAHALDWLVYQDRTLSHTTIDETALKQRYAIMVLFYACGGEGWQGFDEGPLDHQGEFPTCDWDGDQFLECDFTTKEITAIDLSLRRLAGALPEELSLLTSVEKLNFAHNFLEGTIPESYFEQLTNLKHLTLEKNEFTSTLSSSISKLSHLESLLLGDNYMTGPLPDELAQLEHLEILALKDNSMKGPFFKQFGASWPNLYSLSLDGTQFTGTIPQTIDQWNLELLSLDFVQFEGVVPSALETMSSLERLSIASPTLQGTIPDFTNLTNLKHFNLEGAGFTGTIPTTVGLLTDLIFFWIRITSITGTIPTELGNCVNVDQLTLAYSVDLTGTIPTELGNLKKLRTFNVKDSYGLNGTIPETMCDRIGSGGIKVIRNCKIPCDCCVDQCYSIWT